MAIYRIEDTKARADRLWRIDEEEEEEEEEPEDDDGGGAWFDGDGDE